MPTRNFTVAEANRLVPVLESVLTSVERKMRRVQAAAEQLHILDVLWGERVLSPDNPDYAEGQQSRLQIASLMRQIEEIVKREIDGRGLRFPQGGLEHGLIDFPTTWQGREVCLCWKRGEPRIEAWHEVHAGFAGRQTLTSEQVQLMGLASDPDRTDRPVDF